MKDVASSSKGALANFIILGIHFIGVLNSKKAKRRELREQLSNKKSVGNLPEEEEESTDKTDSFDEGSDDEKSDKEAMKDVASSSKGALANFIILGIHVLLLYSSIN
ncbi:hypothetical protein Ddye_031208 [Dipteronia dyeriana]|uniref:Uncharacterized protein n=1 Tax=Dipteronia dyeriana TaxID=168575 RepID=A0AAD9TI43_9ROSI|nr:hypothetical protein Ddye_031208 [Dipteronia dyeriana]